MQLKSPEIDDLINLQTKDRKLEPWIVQAALSQLGEKRLTFDQQRLVIAATRTPHKVHWPDWWEVEVEG